MPDLAQQDAPSPAPHPDIHVGHDGWLFLTGGSNRVLAQFGRPGFPRAALWRWRRILAERVHRCARLGAAYAHTIAPEKLTVYHDAVDGLAFDPERAPALRLRRWLRFSAGAGAFIDLVGPLRAGRHAAPLYRRTDSHWTFEGCEIAYRAILAHWRVPPREDIAARRFPESLLFSGDLAVKLVPAPVEQAEGCLFETGARRLFVNGLLAHYEAMGRAEDAHLGAHAVFANDDPRADPRRLVVFGDSYCQHSSRNPVATLTPFLADTFREVHFLWSPSIDWDYLERVRPDFVLSEIAERFMVELPPRGFRIDLLAELALARKGEA